MTLSISEIARARTATADLLDELELGAYLFEIEPRDGRWELKVECAADGGEAWESITLPVAREALLNSLDDDAAHQRILAEWRRRLVTCKPRD